MSKKQKNVPKLRFPEFTGEWVLKSVGEMTEEDSNYTTLESRLPLFTSSRSGLIYQNQYRSSQTTESKETLFSIVPYGHCTYRHMSDDDVFHLNINTLEKGLVSREYPVFHANETNRLDFLVQHMNSSERFRAFCKGQKKGGTRTRLYYKALCEFKMLVPTIDEQNRVADFLREYDTLITLQQRKLDQIKEYKKGMLQKLFPKEGETVPEVRFPGFSGEWERKKLADVSEIVTGTTPPTKDKDNYGGDKLFVSPADIQDNRYVLNTNTTLTDKGFALGRKLRDGTSLFVSIGSTIGKVAQLKYTATTNQQINAVIPNDEMDDNFVFTMLENEADSIRKLSAQQAVPIINKSSFGNVEVVFPQKAEQIKIGNYFENLDSLITLHQRKLEAMKEYKKGLLQQMFV